MQYQSALSAERLIEFATQRYFGSVDSKDLEGTLACFHDEAIFTVQTDFTVYAGKPVIRRMFEAFFKIYDRIEHREFECIADPVNGRICANFTAELVTANGTRTLLRHMNFWRVRGARFQELYVYLSDRDPLI